MFTSNFKLRLLAVVKPWLLVFAACLFCVRTSFAEDIKVLESVVLIGDAGIITDEMLLLLKAHLRPPSDSTTVVFLGDNVYPRGIPQPSDPDYDRARSHLLKLISAVKDSPGKAVFLPGNHDWDFQGRIGWGSVRREQEIIETHLGKGSFAPREGCPGPVSISVSKHLHIIGMDMQWLLHHWAKPDKTCETASLAEMQQRFIELANDSPPTASVIILSHHPLESYGKHGHSKRCPQGLGCPAYAKVKKALIKTFEKIAPSVCAAAHDHSLQVIQNKPGCKTYLVSGGASDITEVGSGEGTQFAHQGNGLMRLELLSDRRLRLDLYIPDSTATSKEGRGRIVFSKYLEH